jgi:hypothetical protein
MRAAGPRGPRRGPWAGASVAPFADAPVTPSPSPSLVTVTRAGPRPAKTIDALRADM